MQKLTPEETADYRKSGKDITYVKCKRENQTNIK